MAAISPVVATLTLPSSVAIPFRELPSQIEPLVQLRSWLGSGTSGIGLLIGPSESGRTRLVEHLIHERGLSSQRVGLVGGTSGKRSDAGLLRDAITALGQAPAGRTGLELTGELRQIAMNASPDSGPLLLAIDDADFTGSQLEIMAAIFSSPDAPTTTLPLQVLLVGPPELSDRVMRRPRLASLVTARVQTTGLPSADIMRLLDGWLSAVRHSSGIQATMSSDARHLLASVAGFSPVLAFGLVREALTMSLAMGRNHINRGVAETIVANVDPLPPVQSITSAAPTSKTAERQVTMQLPGFDFGPSNGQEDLL